MCQFTSLLILGSTESSRAKTKSRIGLNGPKSAGIGLNLCSKCRLNTQEKLLITAVPFSSLLHNQDLNNPTNMKKPLCQY